MADVDRCVMCGELIPEGRQVCLRCEKRCRAGTTNRKDENHGKVQLPQRRCNQTGRDKRA